MYHYFALGATLVDESHATFSLDQWEIVIQFAVGITDIAKALYFHQVYQLCRITRFPASAAIMREDIGGRR
jgi:hypothetical protein